MDEQEQETEEIQESNEVQQKKRNKIRQTKK